MKANHATRLAFLLSAALFGLLGCALHPASASPRPSPSPALGAPVTLTGYPTASPIPISPYIYGGNNLVSSENAARIQEAGLRFARENEGNNATKYNWEKKISSHPDWYNNVYAHDWDAEAQYGQSAFSGLNMMFAFQLLGKAAKDASHNFDDSFNGYQWWPGVAQNLAGGGTARLSYDDSNYMKALVEGNPDLYLEDWPAAKTVGILGHWFGPGGLGLDQGRFLYWSMDNEPEIWSGTHDDVMKTQCTAAEFMAKYEAVGTAAKAANPAVRLTGPVPCNEWQWYTWANASVNGMPWLEYFISELGSYKIAHGVQLVDMIDIHFYPEESDPDRILQLHRVFFDESYDYPGANGLHALNGGWDESLTKEYVLKRARGWLAANGLAGVGVGVTEMDVRSDDPNVLAVWYASCMGEFMANGGEVFSPWTWKTGMWETLHLFSRYARSQYFPIRITSADDHLVSGYGTVDATSGAVTVFLVNRSRTQARPTSLALKSAAYPDGPYQTLRLSNLPGSETFVSHTKNALVASTVTLSGGRFSLELPPLSVTAVILE